MEIEEGEVNTMTCFVVFAGLWLSIVLSWLLIARVGDVQYHFNTKCDAGFDLAA